MNEGLTVNQTLDDDNNKEAQAQEWRGEKSSEFKSVQPISIVVVDSKEEEMMWKCASPLTLIPIHMDVV